MQITRTASDLTVRAPAKLNLFLEVLGRRDDGYHEIETVMQTVSLFDEITLKPAESHLRLHTRSSDVPHDATNLVVRAAELLREHADCARGAEISLAKRIPVGAGMGGGSSDAAATLFGLNTLWELDLPQDALHALAAELGSDVPFFLTGGTAICRGRGELVTPLADAPTLTYVVVYPGVQVSTREVYKNLPRDLTSDGCEIKLFLKALSDAAVSGGLPTPFNRLEAVTLSRYASLRALKVTMEDCGLKQATMTGSGSAYYGVVPERKEAHRIAETLNREDVGDVFVVQGIR